MTCAPFGLGAVVTSNRIGKEVIETEHDSSIITFYGHSFIADKIFIVYFFMLVKFFAKDGTE